MNRFRRPLVALVLGLLMLGMMAWRWQPAQPAAGASATPAGTATEGPERKTTLQVAFTSYRWLVNRWKDNEALCTLWVEHEGVPNQAEIQAFCDTAVYNLWLTSQPCPQAATGGDITKCTGAYLYLVGSQSATRPVEVDLAPPSVWVSVTGCDLRPPDNRCDSLPRLQFTGEEPLPNETIIGIHGTMAGAPFSCPGSTCEVPISPTGIQGISVEFWADSSYGDSSEHYTALVRAVPWGDFMSPEGASADQQVWYVDVLSTQWRGAPVASCSEVWESFPPLSGLPQWLTTPDRVQDLATNEPLYYLAGVLIESGEVDASDCPNGGISSPGIANPCGFEKARPKLVTWQNSFDEEIIRVARDTGVPAQLMKNVFARESQFWPGIYATYKEAGLGQLTDNGADTVMLWNPSFFNQFCPLVFQKDICSAGWINLTPEHQAMLRGALVGKVNAACPDCPAGIDLSRARFSVNVFAESLRANCEQAGQIIHNVSAKSAGLASSYEDLWIFTLMNYNAGPGCLSTAARAAYQAGEPLDYPHVALNLEEACQGAIDYVESIAGVPAPQAALTATAALPTLAPPVYIATTTPAVARGTPTPGATPFREPTPTAGGYPAPGPSPTPGGYPAPEPSPTTGGYP